MRITILSCFVFLTALPMTPGVAEVIDASANGFAIRQSLAVDAAAPRLYNQLVDVASWWNSAHTFSGKASNLSLVAKAGGCWCERLPNGGSVQHLTVLRVEPGKLLVLGGALGPLQGSGLNGALSFGLEPQGKSTRLTLDYQAGGYFRGDLPAMAKLVDQVLAEQLGRLKAAAEPRP